MNVRGVATNTMPGRTFISAVMNVGLTDDVRSVYSSSSAQDVSVCSYHNTEMGFVSKHRICFEHIHCVDVSLEGTSTASDLL